MASAREQFDRQARKYNERWASWSDETLKTLLALADPQPDWRILDVATGTGFTALAFAPQVASVVGADISPGMLAQAQKRAVEVGADNVEWVEAPAESLPFTDASFDLVTVRIAPHHFTDVDAFLLEVHRVLKPNGVFVLGDTTIPDNDTEAADWQNKVEKERDPSHIANLSPHQWREKCEKAGLGISHCETAGGGIPLEVTAWLDTAGCIGEQAARVRQWFADAPPSACAAFQISVDPTTSETRFVWLRVVLRATLVH